MTLNTKTRFDIGETVYFLNFNHEINKGTVTRISSETIVYKDTYTGAKSCYTSVRYDVHTDDYVSDNYSEDNLYSTPEEIVSMLNDQIERGDFD